MAQKRIQREFKEIEDAWAAGEPWACGLAITHKDGNLFQWMCTYTCPQHYVFRGEQRVSPYAGHIIRFVITFPADYPFTPFKLSFQRTVRFFHPLISRDATVSGCTAFIHGLDKYLGSSVLMTVPRLLQEGLLPMWTDGDCWVPTDPVPRALDTSIQPFWRTCLYSRAGAHIFKEDPAEFPLALQSFEGDIRPFIEQLMQAREAARLSRAAEATARQLAVETAAQSEMPFRVIISFKNTRECMPIQMFPSFSVGHLLEAIIVASAGRISHYYPQIDLSFSGTRLERHRSLNDYNIREGSCVYVDANLCGYGRHLCRPCTDNGINPVAAHLLLNDVLRFEHFARQSWSDPSAPPPPEALPFHKIVELIGQLSCITLPRPLSLLPQPPRVLPLLPSADTVSLRAYRRQLLVFSGWTMVTVRALLSQSPSIAMHHSKKILLSMFVRRRMLGFAGVRRLARGLRYPPSAPPPPACRQSRTEPLPEGFIWTNRGIERS